MSRYCNANELHVKGETARLKRAYIITVYNIEMNGCMFVCVDTAQVRIQRGGGGGGTGGQDPPGKSQKYRVS